MAIDKQALASRNRRIQPPPETRPTNPPALEASAVAGGDQWCVVLELIDSDSDSPTFGEAGVYVRVLLKDSSGVWRATGDKIKGDPMPGFAASHYAIPGVIQPLQGSSDPPVLGLAVAPCRLLGDGTVMLVDKPYPGVEYVDPEGEFSEAGGV